MNKEQVYDKMIYPLLEDVVNICREHGIAMVTAFEVPTDEKPNQIVTTIVPDGEGYNGFMHAEALSIIRCETLEEMAAQGQSFPMQ